MPDMRWMEYEVKDWVKGKLRPEKKKRRHKDQNNSFFVWTVFFSRRIIDFTRMTPLKLLLSIIKQMTAIPRLAAWEMDLRNSVRIYELEEKQINCNNEPNSFLFISCLFTFFYWAIQKVKPLTIFFTALFRQSEQTQESNSIVDFAAKKTSEIRRKK